MRTIPKLLGLLSLLTLLPKASLAGDGLAADLKLLKAAPSTAVLRQRLLAVGFSGDLLDQVATRKGPGDDRLFSLPGLKRAESWQVDLDPDKDAEQVVQVLFQSETQAMEFKTAYLILVRDAPAQDGRVGKVLGEYLFDVDGCDYASDKPMTLSFAPARGKRWKQVRFTVGRATSCGTYVEIATRRDVLAWNEKRGRLELSRGKEDTAGVDRMDLTRP
jgi:hypothetical protein